MYNIIHYEVITKLVGKIRDRTMMFVISESVMIKKNLRQTNRLRLYDPEKHVL